MKRASYRPLQNVISNKRILYITTSSLNYIRSIQELKILETHASYVLKISPEDKDEQVRPLNLKRLLLLLMRILFLKKGGFDLIFIGGTPQVLLPLIYFFFRKKIVIIDFFISLYDTLIFDRKVCKKTSSLARVVKYLDRKTLQTANYVICDTKAHRLFFSSFFKIDLERFITIYLEADTTIYYPTKVTRSSKYIGKFIVFFFGAMNPLQGFEIILKAAKSLMDNNKSIVFFIVGPVQKLNYWDKYKQLPNIAHMADWISQTEIAKYVAMSDLCLAGHFNNSIEKAKRVIPGKAYSYLSMNKKTILGDNPANRELYNEKNENIFFVEMGNAKKLENKIQEIYEIHNNS